MPLGSLLLAVLILMVIGVILAWPHSMGWGYGLTGAGGILILVVVILVLTRRM